MSENQKKYSLRRVFKGASVYSIGNVFTKASGFFLIPLYTRVLTPSDFGIVGYLQVFLRVASIVVAFGFTGAQTRYYYENSADKDAVGRFAFTINLVPFAFAVFLLIPLSLFSVFFNWHIGATAIPFYPFMVLTLWTVFFQVFSDNAMGFYRAQQRFSLSALLQIIRFLSVTVITIILIVEFDLGALGRIGGLFLGAVFFVLVSSIGYIKQFVFKPSKEAIKYSLSFGAPVVIHLLAASIHNSIDRVMLESYISLDNLGIYSLAFSIGSTMSLFITGFNKAFQPSYYQLMSEDRKDTEYQVIKAFKVWLLLMTSIACAGILLGAPFLRVFAGPAFSETIHIFPWIILAIYLSSYYYFFSSPIFYFKKTKLLPLITGGSALFNIGLNFLLIPQYGMYGAAIATVFSHVVQSVLALFFGNRLYKLSWPYRWIVVAVFVTCLSVFIAKYIWS